MGLTPQEGLVMGTRSGDVDPNLHSFIQEKEDRQLREITEMLTRRSGLLGVSGVSHDMRSVMAASADGNIWHVWRLIFFVTDWPGRYSDWRPPSPRSTL